MRNFLLTRASFLDLHPGDHFPWLCSNTVTRARVWYDTAALRVLGGLCMAVRQPHTSADTDPPSGRTGCNCWDHTTVFAISSSPAKAWTWVRTLFFWSVAGKKPQCSSLLSCLPKLAHPWPELEEGATGPSHLQVLVLWPSDSRGLQPSLPT